MNPSRLIDAKLRGATFDRIMHSILTDREHVSELSDDLVEFYDSMIVEINVAVKTLESAVKSDDRDKIRELSISLKEIFSMMEDSCEG